MVLVVEEGWILGMNVVDGLVQVKVLLLVTPAVEMVVAVVLMVHRLVLCLLLLPGLSATQKRWRLP